MRIKITQYGKSKKTGGWDEYGDSYTDNWEGDHGNKLVNGVSCALTDSAKRALGVVHGDELEIVFEDGTKTYRRYDDTAPESEPRVDLFNYYGFTPNLSTYAEVRKMPNNTVLSS